MISPYEVTTVRVCFALRIQTLDQSQTYTHVTNYLSGAGHYAIMAEDTIKRDMVPALLRLPVY